MSGAASRSGPTRRRFSLGRLVFDNPVYALTLKGRRPKELAASPEDPWPGDPKIADALFQGRYRFAGEEVHRHNLPPWDGEERSDAWMAELHGFAWLRHFTASGGEAAKRQARALVASWLSLYAQWDALAWRPDVLGQRLIAWFANADLLLDGADATFRAGVLRSMARQSRHLARSARSAGDGAPRLIAVSGLIHAGICLPGGGRLARGLRLLEQELAQQILADGGHVARSPAMQMKILRDLVQLRGALLSSSNDVPTSLQNAIDRMAPLLRFFRHGDGRLALFHGSSENAEAEIDLTLTRADAKGKPPASAPYTGFERAAAKRALLIVDVGAPPMAETGVMPHAAPLALEFSVGRERILVNCGSPANPASAMARALRQTAAHATAVLADTDAVEMRRGGASAASAVGVSCERNEADGSVWLDARHDGYWREFGLAHRRRLFLDASGDDLRGEDTFSGTGRRPVPFHIRFHLHPDVDASLVQNGASVLLKLASGAGYRFRASGGAVRLEESIYFGSGAMRRTEQIVISGTTAPQGETRVKWALGKAPAS
ncbi:MAG TPA: heparinase II/III family protein [Candidatus Cybelea sp.]|nr:heparinase II/III family protein [Candidatus Cybelea sp.]